MAGAALEIKLDESAWAAARDAFARMAGNDQTAFLEFIGAELKNIAQDAFATESDPTTGEAWAPWSPSYAAKQGKKGGPGSKKLDRHGDLFRSIDYGVLAGGVAVGSNMQHAPTHQFGAKKGAYGQTRRGHSIPFGDIPARPYLGVPPDFADRILGDPAILELLGLPT
ncbi:MAG: hypothetical protein A2Y38_20115 [Spirochaetes bacterium GWB1_59_5]|nr:MAG: hypothetical protein A2Y38_20115 [Spirochaetes bacterium GWB1_59_5]